MTSPTTTHSLLKRRILNLNVKTDIKDFFICGCGCQSMFMRYDAYPSNGDLFKSVIVPVHSTRNMKKGIIRRIKELKENSWMFPLQIGEVLNQDHSRRENAKTMFNGVSEVIQEEGILCKKSREIFVCFNGLSFFDKLSYILTGECGIEMLMCRYSFTPDGAEFLYIGMMKVFTGLDACDPKTAKELNEWWDDVSKKNKEIMKS